MRAALGIIGFAIILMIVAASYLMQVARAAERGLVPVSLHNGANK